MRWAPASSASSAEPELYRRGESFRIPGHAGRRHGRARGARRGRDRARLDARRQGADPARAEDLSLSRPLDVRPGQIPDARGSAGRCASTATRSSMPQARARASWASSEDELKAIDKRDQGRSSSKPPISPKKRPSPSRPNSTPTCWWRATDGDRAQDARSVPDDGGGHARQMAGQGRRRGQVGRHPRRDRDRQGDDGVRGGRRRHDRQDPGPRRHRRREGRHGRSRCMAGEGEDAARGCRRRAAEPTPAAEAAEPTRRPSRSRRRSQGRDRHRAAGRRRRRAAPPIPKCPTGTDDGPDRPSARRCATRWPRKCAATSACS